MKAVERDMLHDALAAAVTTVQASPTLQNEYILTGMRRMAALLGMPEGQPDYTWGAETASLPISRQARRRHLLARLRGRH